MKCQMQNDRDKNLSIRASADLIMKKDGIKGFFRGGCIYLARDVPTYGAYFYTY